MYFLIKGIVLGFSIAAPVGPIGILCIRKTLQFGRLSGFFSGLGAALADMIYGSIAAFGLTIISNALLASQFWLKLIGGIFLGYLGIKTFFSKSMKQEDKKLTHQPLLKDFITTFFLTLTNPMTIIAFLGIFAGLGLSNTDGNLLQTSLLVIGVFLGSFLWWLVLSEFVTFFRKKIEEKMMRWINRIAGLIIFGFGVFALSGLFN
ncbi:MAG: lysine transporter LysE [Chlamydiae bacterium RIFCSPHIGHO2_12_FULL_27_8]|nr:MAG: lysine transporter LysE [Chlamydiae bacterium RIFCSPHIGHO2_12_FULL_27_8]